MVYMTNNAIYITSRRGTRDIHVSSVCSVSFIVTVPASACTINKTMKPAPDQLFQLVVSMFVAIVLVCTCLFFKSVI
jgi:hypothetical protein